MNTRKRILHVITSLNDGGAEAVLYRLCTYDALSIHHVVSLMGMGKYGTMLKARGIHVTCLNMPRGRVTLYGMWKLWSLMRKQRPAAVQTWMYHADLIGGTVARLAGIRKIYWNIRNSNLDPHHSTRATLFVAKACAHLSRWVPARIICCSQKAINVHSELGYCAEIMHLIPNGYDLSVFRPDPQARAILRSNLGIQQETFLVGFVARFDPQKDHAGLLKAFSILKRKYTPPTCLLIGSGVDETNFSLKRIIADLGLSDYVRLLGRRTDIHDLMNTLDVHIMSSAYGEAFPNVLAEAMACGTPCITTDVGDAAIIVGDTGWVVPPNNAEALADAISQALAERASPTWTNRKQRARRRIESTFGMDTMIKRYHALWSS